MLTLRNQLEKIPNFVPSLAKNGNKTVSFFALATLVSGVNWYIQNQMLHQKNQTENQLIKRVANDQTKQDFHKKFNIYDTPSWNCKKVTMDAQLGQGRFIIKRNRGSQQGYLVFAPVTIAKDSVPQIHDKMQQHKKFMLNMGWIPKSSKHMILSTIAQDTLGQNDYTQDIPAARQLNRIKGDNLNRAPHLQENYIPLFTFSAFVRTGERQNKARGWANFQSLRLFKFIDLHLLSRVFRISNTDEASTVYFDRIASSQQQSENLPLPTSKQQVIQDLKQNIQWNNKQTSSNISKVFWGSYGAALLFSLV